MIKALENQIKVMEEEDGILFTKDTWFPYEIELATSLNLVSKGGGIYADMRTTSRKALFEFMKTTFKNFTNGDKYKDFRKMFYEELSFRYDTMYKQFDSELATKLPYYDILYDHQKEAIFMMCHRRHNLLSFEQGLGKTITSLSVSIMLKHNKTLVICPSVAKWNWYEELQKWGVNKNTISIVDSKGSINAEKEEFIIINFELLKKHLDKLMARRVDHIIIDEAHYIKNPTSQRYENVYNIATQTGAKISLLTGTPIKNKVDDLFAYLKLCKQFLGQSYRNFIDEYTYNHDTSYGVQVVRGKNLEKLQSMLSNFMIRRTKKECLDLPDKVIRKYYFELEDYRSEYKKAVKEFTESKSSDLQTSIHTINIVTTKSKIKGISNLIEDLIYNGKKVVVFTSYTEPYDMLMQNFEGRCVGIDGRVPTNKRQDIVNRFKTDEQVPLFVGNISAAGVAITLVESSEVIFCNLPFTNAELEQAVDRVHRIGQEQQVNVYYTLCRNTTDEILYNIISSKASDSNDTIDLHKETIDLRQVPEKLFRELTKTI
jgi:SWI/SNF-related matrix-associated actin-dependent regulator 1 of chromatin subfamily A